MNVFNPSLSRTLAPPQRFKDTPDVLLLLGGVSVDVWLGPSLRPGSGSGLASPAAVKFWAKKPWSRGSEGTRVHKGRGFPGLGWPRTHLAVWCTPTRPTVPTAGTEEQPGAGTHVTLLANWRGPQRDQAVGSKSIETGGVVRGAVRSKQFQENRRLRD